MLSLKGALLAGILAGACAPELVPDPPPPATGAILVCIDTLRVDHVGAYGYPRETTPHLDRLAAEGTLFDWTISQSNWTVPATATLLTSLYPTEHGAMIQGEIKHLEETPPAQLRRNVETLADILQRGGFHTGLFSANPFLYGRFKRGFDTAEVEWQSAASLTEKVIAWLQDRPTKPFFVHLQYMDLHHPIEPPEPYFNYFEVPEGGERGPEHKGWSFFNQTDLSSAPFLQYRAHKIALYDGALRYVDAEIGRLVDALADLGVLDQTLLVVTSDHGEEFWDHAELENRIATDPRALWGIGHGHSMFQELLRVPLILHGPRVAKAARIDCAARHLDVAPTLLALLGLPEQPQMRGINLAPYWRAGRGGRECRSVPQIAESPAYGPDAQALIWKQRKLIRIRDGLDLLFDLRSDPGERNDLSHDQPEIVRALGEMLARELTQARSTADELGDAHELEPDSETEKQLRALGYLGQ